MRRRTRLLVVVPALGLVGLAGCAPFHAGAAATVGSQRITTQDLRTIMDRETPGAAAYKASAAGQTAIAGGQAPAAAVSTVMAQQRALAELIQIDLLKQVAVQLHATIADNAVSRERAQVVSEQQGGTDAEVQQLGAYAGVDLQTFSEFTAYLDADTAAAAPSDDDVRAFVAAPDHRVVQVQRVDIQSQALAGQFADQVRQQPGSFATAVQSGGGSATTAVYTARAFEALAPGATLTAGGIVGPVRVNDSDYAVFDITVLESHTADVALDPTSLERQALTEERFDTAYAHEVSTGVHVSPRFGAWSFPTSDGLGTVGDLPPLSQLSKQVSTSTTAATTTTTTTGS